MKYIIIIFVITLLFLLISRFIAQKFIYFTSIKDMEISEVQDVELNGITQKILIEEKAKDSPILIMVHGGPGLPVPFGVAFRGQFPELTNQYLLVQWDHYGSGVNYTSNTSSTIDDYVLMLEDLVLYMNEEYPNREIFLFGMSWGTILNTKVANKIPDKIDGVIAYGQYSNSHVWKQAMYDELHKQQLSEREINQIDSAMVNDTKDGFQTLLDIATKKTNLYYYKGEEASNWDFYMHAFHIMISPDYSILDAIHAYSNPSGDALMYNEVLYINMSEDQQAIKVPYLILQGEDDLITPVSYNEDLIKRNEHMTLQIYEDAGHIPTNKSYEQIFESITIFTTEIIEKVHSN